MAKIDVDKLVTEIQKAQADADVQPWLDAQAKLKNANNSIAPEQGALESQSLFAVAISGDAFQQLTPAEKVKVFQSAARGWEGLQQVEDDL